MNMPAGVWKSAGTNLPEHALTLAVPAERRLNKQQLLTALADALQFPDYFGQNWDAAWDCLTDLDWQDAHAITLLLPLSQQQPVDAGDLTVFVDLLAEAAEHWQAQQRQLALVVVTQRDDLPCLASLALLE